MADPITTTANPAPDEAQAKKDIATFPTPMDLARELEIPSPAAARLLTYVTVQHVEELDSEKKKSMAIGGAIGAAATLLLGGIVLGTRHLMLKSREKHKQEAEQALLDRLHAEGKMLPAASGGASLYGPPREEEENDEEPEEEEPEEEQEQEEAPRPLAPRPATPMTLRPVAPIRPVTR
jgi:hypothetical protein